MTKHVVNSEDSSQHKKEPRIRILVVDDEPGLRAMLEWELSDRGMDVEVAKDGQEAAEMAATRPYDIVVTDLTMPRADGLTLLEGLKKNKPGIHVIVATGFGTVEVAVHAMQRGALDFLLKPVDMEVLVARIKNISGSSASCCNCHAHQQNPTDAKNTR
jgi:DNA-binding NtrC family response regulator